MDGHQVITGHHFISYSRRESKDFVAKLRSALLLESPAIRVWLDTRDIRPGREWDEQIHEAIKIAPVAHIHSCNYCCGASIFATPHLIS